MAPKRACGTEEKSSAFFCQLVNLRGGALDPISRITWRNYTYKISLRVFFKRGLLLYKVVFLDGGWDGGEVGI